MKRIVILTPLVIFAVSSHSAQQSMRGFLFYPRMPTLAVGAPNISGTSLDADGEKVGQILTMPEETCIKEVVINAGSVGTPGNYDINIETVDPLTGFPSGTLWATNTSSAAFRLASTNLFYTVVLQAGATIPAATPFALTATRNGAGNIAFPSIAADYAGVVFAYAVSSTSSAGYTKSAGAPVQAFFKTCSGEFKYNPNVMSPINNTTSFNNTTNPNFRGFKFALPVPSVFSGFWGWAAFTANLSMHLYDSDGATLLASVDISTRSLQSATGPYIFPSTNTVSLSANTFYRVAYVPATSTSVSVYDMQVASATVFDVLDGGSSFYMTIATGVLSAPSGETSWTDTGNRRVMGGLLLQSFDDGVGGGGGTTVTPFFQ